jgi:hypothetical protein
MAERKFPSFLRVHPSRRSHFFSLSSFLSSSARPPAAAGLHIRPAREPDLRTSEARPGWPAAPVDRAIRPAKPRLDRLAARRGVRRGVLDRRRSRRRPLGAATAARARVSHEAAWRGRDIVAARVVCAAPFCVRSQCVIRMNPRRRILSLCGVWEACFGITD